MSTKSLILDVEERIVCAWVIANPIRVPTHQCCSCQRSGQPLSTMLEAAGSGFATPLGRATGALNMFGA